VKLSLSSSVSVGSKVEVIIGDLVGFKVEGVNVGVVDGVTLFMAVSDDVVDGVFNLVDSK
jgi:hypothetical protein